MVKPPRLIFALYVHEYSIIVLAPGDDHLVQILQFLFDARRRIAGESLSYQALGRREIVALIGKGRSAAIEDRARRFARGHLGDPLSRPCLQRQRPPSEVRRPREIARLARDERLLGKVHRLAMTIAHRAHDTTTFAWGLLNSTTQIYVGRSLVVEVVEPAHLLSRRRLGGSGNCKLRTRH